MANNTLFSNGKKRVSMVTAEMMLKVSISQLHYELEIFMNYCFIEIESE